MFSKMIEGVRVAVEGAKAGAVEGAKAGAAIGRRLLGNEKYLAEVWKAYAFLSDSERVEMAETLAANVRHHGVLVAGVINAPVNLRFYRCAARALVRGERLWAGVTPEAIRMSQEILMQN